MSEICNGDISSIVLPQEDHGERSQQQVSPVQDMNALLKSIPQELLLGFIAQMAKQQELPVSRSPSPPKMDLQEKVVLDVKISQCCAQNKGSKQRCANKAKPESDFCPTHQSATLAYKRSPMPQKVVCGFPLKKGPCQNYKGSCHLHKDL